MKRESGVGMRDAEEVSKMVCWDLYYGELCASEHDAVFGSLCMK